MLNEIVGTMSFLQPEANDDGIDRLNYYYTSTVLIVSALLISIKMFGGRPLECWLPAEYTNTWESYSEMYCWAQNTYFASFDDNIPQDVQERKHKEISYYQWSPFVLLLMAFLTYLPCLIWRYCNGKSGVRLADLIGITSDKTNMQQDVRTQNVRGLANHLSSIFRHQYTFCKPLNDSRISMHRFAKWLNIRHCAAFMTLLYLFIKTLYIVSSIGLLFLMNKILQTDDYSAYGVGVLRDLLNGREWKTSGNFPRVTLCDMQIRVLGNVQTHTVQCVMVINIFLEKLFVLLWIWFSILSVFNVLSLIHWIQSTLIRKQRYKFVCRRLELADGDFKVSDREDDVNDFTDNWIKMDGVFVLRIIAMHSGAMMCTEVLDAMWDLYEEDLARKREETKALIQNIHLANEEKDGEDGDEGEVEGEGEDESGDIANIPMPPISPTHRKHSLFAPLVTHFTNPDGRPHYLRRKSSIQVPFLRTERYVQETSTPKRPPKARRFLSRQNN